MPISPSPELHRPLIRHRRTLPGMRVVTLSPSVALAFVGLTSLLFVPVIGSLGALGFIVAALGLVALSAEFATRSFWNERLFLILAGWCLISFLWSDYAALTLRYALQLALTLGFAVLIAYRVTPDAFVKLATSAYAIMGIASLVSGRARDDGPLLGIFQSKNALAGASGFLMIGGISLLADRRLPSTWRVFGAAALGVGTLLVVKAQSAGMMLTVVLVGGLFLMLLGLRKLSPVMRLMAAVLLVLALALIALLIASFADELARLLLDSTGKDVTLTGRTDLWATALSEIARRPLLGAGFQAVWVRGNPLAEQLWAQFGVSSGSGFNFHNTLLSNAVEIGLIGAALQAVLLFGALPPLLLWSLRSRRAGPLFLTLILGRQVALMGLEVTFFFQFDPTTVLTAAAIAYAHRYRAEMRAAG